MATERSRKWTRQEARAEIDRWRASGVSVAAYCRERGIQPERLYRWQERLSEGRSGRKGQAGSTAAVLVGSRHVGPVPPAAGGVAPRRTGSTGGGPGVGWLEATVTGVGAAVAAVTVQLRSGARIDVAAPEQVEASWLSALVRGLSGEA
jgi:transposase-like protein